jgi:hypothetical protein
VTCSVHPLLYLCRRIALLMQRECSEDYSNDCEVVYLRCTCCSAMLRVAEVSSALQRVVAVA